MKLERGFSLLEALVALVILSAAIGMTFVWVDGSLKQTERVKKSNEAIKLARGAVARIGPHELLRSAEGNFVFEDFEVFWSGKIRDRAVGVSTNGVRSNFDLALFDLFLVIKDERGEIDRFKTRKAVFRTTGNKEADGPN
ncbi:MAG: type II secretion system protein [Candidatus Azotimanducaceae bacterium]